MSDESVQIQKALAAHESSLREMSVGEDEYPYSYNNYIPEETDEIISLRRLLQIILKRKWLIISLCAIVTSFVALWMYKTKPVYQASTIIEIGNEAGQVKGQRLITEENEYSSDSVLYGINTKMLALRSRPLLEEVVLSQGLDKNPKFTEDANSRPFTEDTPRVAQCIDVLKNNLQVDSVKDTLAIEVSYTHTDPIIAAAVANAVAQTFIDRNFKNKTETITNAANWLDRSMLELKERSEVAEQTLANYVREHSIFPLNGNEKEVGATLTTKKLAELQDQLMRAETDRALKESLYREIKAGRVAQLPDNFSDPKLVGLEKQLGELMTLRAQLSVKYGTGNPKYMEVEQQINSTQKQIDASRTQLEQKITADYERAVRDEASLTSAFGATKAATVVENQAAVQYTLLKQNAETARQLYTEFLQKVNQAHVQLAEQVNNIRVLEPARVPSKPSGPKRLMWILVAAFLSLGAGVMISFVLEHFDNTVKSVEDIQRYVQLQTVGIIPATKASRLTLLLAKQSSNGEEGSNGFGSNSQSMFRALDSDHRVVSAVSSVSEAYRALRTVILLSANEGPSKTILFTSIQPGEGKTTTALNSALSFAQLGRSVLLVDCDLRKPALDRSLDLSNHHGLSTYLTGKAELRETIQTVDIPNLDVVTSGPIPSNPAELISSERMKGFLRMCSESYDHVFIDSPPLLNVTDPVIISTLVDGVILVVNEGKNPKQVMRFARNELFRVKARILGVVLNKVRPNHLGYNYHIGGEY